MVLKLLSREVYLEPFQASKIELSAREVSNKKLPTILAKSTIS